jgi:hypothetical protein
MESFRAWSFAQVLLVSAGWILAWVLLGAGLAAGFFYLQLRSSRGAGSGAIGIGISEIAIIAMLAFLLGPPLLLIATWWIVHNR